jgi:microcompartment protein CcmK/EutM
MFIAKVVGRIWATRKSPGLKNQTLFIVQPLDGVPPRSAGDPIMAVCDQIDAGPGDIVLVMDEGGSARSILSVENAPIRTIIVGVIDQIKIHDKVYRTDHMMNERS